ncbi:response regulator transcription factor [Stenotrophomonas nitritireducens]|uniref:response regulator transcription factor n=1 Tax=Stenotrophomonas nitritireducens TaxID=83617 RepID=UPI003D96B361
METKRDLPLADMGRQLQGVRTWVVEDDPEWRDLVVDELERHGAVVRGIDSVEALYRELAVDRCDIVVLDVVLPGEDGLSAARHLRRIDDMGIVLVTGRSSAADMAHGLSAGADVYLAKPLELPVLVAALHSLHRRMASRRGSTHAVAREPAPVAARGTGDGWSLRAGGWELWAPNGRSLLLTVAERTLLQELFSAPGTPLGRARLIAALSPTPRDFDPHRLEVLVHRLRTRVRTATDLALPVRTLRGAGYLLVSTQS